MNEEKLRLGGMALANGVLVHGPTAWACAVRTEGGDIAVASGRKTVLSVSRPFLRGPARLAESLLVLPQMKRSLPEARFAFQSRRVLGALLAAGAGARLARESKLPPALRELVAGLFALAPGLIALRQGELAAYHGAEHVSIGTYEHGVPAAKEHERCGSHLVGPLLLASAAGATIADKAPERLRRPAAAAASIGAVAVATEVFGWMTRHPGHPAARALALPGHQLQERIGTAEPSPAQIEVADAALRACLELEHGRRRD